MMTVAAVEVHRAPSCWAHHPLGMDGRVLRVELDGRNTGWEIKGILSKLDYLVEIGVKIVWISPIYKSPMKDFGYDIEDFREIDEVFGTMADFEELVKEMKKKDLKLVMDFIPNHTSDRHQWFQKSIDRVEPYSNYYVWVPPKKYDNGKPVPPNNWMSVFGGSAWEFNQKRKEFYLHQFAKEQPDLNHRNTEVTKEIMDVAKFWLDKGVDGFRLDAVAHIFEDPELRDEPLKGNKTVSDKEFSYDSLSHIYTHSLPEVMDVIKAFRDCLDGYSSETDGVPRLLMAEVYDSIEETMKYYGIASQPLADFPFNFLFITNINATSTAQDIMNNINLWLKNMPKGMDANWVLGNHDQKRVATRLGPELVDAMHMVALLLPGTAVTYYGEEIGMEDALISWKETVDPAGINAGEKNYTAKSRDPARTPMQWNDENNAGFSTSNKTWLPVNKNYTEINVEAEREKESHFNVYKDLVKARNSSAVRYGSLEMHVLSKTVFAYTRSHPGSESYLVAINPSEEPTVVDLGVFKNMADTASVYVQSIHSAKKEKTISNVHAVPFGPKEGLVLTYTPKMS